MTSTTPSVSTPREGSVNGRFVVVCVDGSSDSERAIRFGVQEARRRGVGLRLVHVQAQVVPMAAMLPAVPASTLHEVAAGIVKSSEETARSSGWDEPDVDVVLENGPRRDAIFAHTGDAACIVLGRRSSTVDHLISGSTTSSLAAHADVPVISVPDGWEPSAHHDLVVAGIDACDCEEGRTVIDAAFEEAGRRSARLRLLHAWRPANIYDMAIDSRVLSDLWAGKAQEGLADQARATRGSETVEWSARAAYDRPALALHRASGEADLLVVGRHGHDSRIHLSLGSTARAVLRAARCPVMVVPTVPHRGSED